MKSQTERFKTSKEFGNALGLSDLDIQLIKQKKRVIEKLRKEREAQELTQAQLAKLIGSKQPAIARMESGLVSEISFDFLLRVALALEVSISFRPKAA